MQYSYWFFLWFSYVPGSLMNVFHAFVCSQSVHVCTLLCGSVQMSRQSMFRVCCCFYWLGTLRTWIHYFYREEKWKSKTPIYDKEIYSQKTIALKFQGPFAKKLSILGLWVNLTVLIVVFKDGRFLFEGLLWVSGLSDQSRAERGDG